MKVDSNGDGCWHCNRCNQSCVRGDYRYMILVQIQDATGMAYEAMLLCWWGDIWLQSQGAPLLVFLKHERRDHAQLDGTIQSALFRDSWVSIQTEGWRRDKSMMKSLPNASSGWKGESIDWKSSSSEWALYPRRKLNSEAFIDRRLSKCTIVNVEALNPSSESHCLVRVIIKLLQGNLGSASVCHTPGTIVGTKTDLSDVEVWLLRHC